jgi:hypothetical protein
MDQSHSSLWSATVCCRTLLVVGAVGRAEEVRPLADDLRDEVGVVVDLVGHLLGA